MKPQAFEWLFCVAAGFPFNVSCDNLEGDVGPDRIAFQRRVHARVMALLEQGIPERPARFIRALQHYYQTPPLTAEHFRGRKTCTKAAHYMTRGKMMIAEFESRILALIDNMVDHASDDELFAGGYLRGHLTLAVAELER